MIRSLLRDSQSYFQSYKIYFVAIYLSFLAFPVGDLTLIAAPEPIWMRLALSTNISLIRHIFGAHVSWSRCRMDRPLRNLHL